MPHDFRAKPLSDEQVCRYAKQARDAFGQSAASRIDIIECLKSKSIWTIRGVKPLRFSVVPDAEMGDDDGKTTVTSEEVSIQIKHSVFEDAKYGVGRARHTCAHEIAHGVMHESSEMLRVATGNTKHFWLKPYESGEHQAGVFATAFLINDEIAEKAVSASDISVQAGISMESAKIYFSNLEKRRNRARTAEKIQLLRDEYMNERRDLSHSLHYLDEPCTVCGSRTVFPVGSKYMCQECDTVSDRYQDGDPG
ncbi:ImmA/IrrE family metallo-endopeptidase [Methylocystis sp. B8]|uniref:ImmA/IrrE family metallo-endopeptidase n=1 Tax=Methylocystis sp. B8 TaxID=544938 RepID=UPI0010FDECBA|nr:ImmA/IrrE family metallo-endopeptidase [Methylocystis sp. B8]TLG74096.1 ImmA/IrrE family metallo-endopeptidase [Methylocystis sp. B8]